MLGVVGVWGVWNVNTTTLCALEVEAKCFGIRFRELGTGEAALKFQTLLGRFIYFSREHA